MPTRLTDGQPLTLEWLNSIISEIEELRSVVNAGDTARRPVNYTGNLSTYSKVQVEARSISIGTITKGGISNKSVAFAVPFNKAPLVVVNTKRNGGGVCAVTIRKVTADGFTFNVGPTSNAGDLTLVSVDYIAIGESK